MVEVRSEQPDATGPQAADPEWFRSPTRREHWIGAGLFLGFGLFFATLFALQSGWWFRWVMLGLAVVSTVRGLRHLLGVLAATVGAPTDQRSDE
jgi:hypothetical protein